MRAALICRDRPGALQTRVENRVAHLAHIERTGIVEMAGPFLNDASEMIGSLIVLTVDDMDQARAWAAADPYAMAGLFESVTILEWRKVVG